MLKAAQKGNPGAIKFGVAYLVKYRLSITDIGIEIVFQQYIKTGDRSLIDLFYDKSLFTASQWDQIATDARRKNSFAGIILPSLLYRNTLDSLEYLRPLNKTLDQTFKTFVNKMPHTQSANDVKIYNMIHDALLSKYNIENAQYMEQIEMELAQWGAEKRRERKRKEEAKHRAWLKESGWENVPPEVIRKFYWVYRREML